MTAPHPHDGKRMSARHAPAGQAAPAPLLSVVICTHNRAACLRQAIASALAQNVPDAAFEVLVVDNRSSDDTAQLCAELAKTGNLRYIYEPRLGLCYARNTGWQNARGTYVVYLDDDAIAEPGWLAAVTAAFARTPSAGVVGGRVDPIWEAERPAWLSDDIALSLTIVDWSAEPKTIPDVRIEWLVGANMAVPAAVLAEVGGFEPRLDRVGGNMLTGGDVFLQQQIIARGYTCVYHPGMAVRHLVPRARLTQRWFVRRYYWQGISDAVMELITKAPSPASRLRSALARVAALLAEPRALVDLVVPSNDPARFQRRCFALIRVGHIAGLLGAARR